MRDFSLLDNPVDFSNLDSPTESASGGSSFDGMSVAMGGMGLAKGFLQYASSYSQSKALELEAEQARVKGRFKSQALGLDAQLSDMQAQDVRDQGPQMEGKVLKRGNEIAGQQRVSFAGQGVSTNSGTAADVISQTKKMTDLDILKARTNAWRSAWGYSVQASNQRFESANAVLEGDANAAALEAKAAGTMVTGGIGLLTSGISTAALLA